MSLDEKVIAILKPDVLSPADTEQKLEAIGVSKAAMPLRRMVPLGILAGMFIAMGAMMLGLVLADSTLPFAAQRLLGGLVFCTGLVLVVLAGAELFTGNNLIIVAVASGKASWGAYVKNLVLIWITNFIGSLIAVAIVYLANTHMMAGGAVGDELVNLAQAKTALPPLTLFFKAILCNFLVCLAVWMSFAGRSFIDKFVAILFPITAFVAAGAEHSVANMFFLPMGFLLKTTGATSVDPSALPNLDLAGVFYNLGMVTLGNIVGGAVLVGLMYWWAFHKKKAE
ncbi:MAG: formate/nitrite transporter family protein [Coriobacteriales bacterium]|nr:formate/nitrite transporter family protein [Coriobacteriales bacterium]